MEKQQNIDFDRSKIYEKLDYNPMPSDYKNNIPWNIQNQISATNGIHYKDKVGKLKEIPTYSLPIESVNEDKLMLDIGAGWGRWLISGHNKGYIPIGLDLRLEFCETQQKVLKLFNIKGYSVAADLENIPFLNSTFDFVWSFSVIQHTHIERLRNCLDGINNVIRKTGFTYLEFPNKNGIRNRNNPVKSQLSKKDDYNSWRVRYYTPNEYKDIFDIFLTNFSFKNHSFLGIGVLKEDLKYVSLKYKIPVLCSLILSYFCEIIPKLKYFSDSIYIKAVKKSDEEVNSELKEFIFKHKNEKFDNLNIINLLKCPISGNKVELSSDRKKVLSKQIGIYYPIINDIPIMIKSEAQRI